MEVRNCYSTDFLCVSIASPVRLQENAGQYKDSSQHELSKQQLAVNRGCTP